MLRLTDTHGVRARGRLPSTRRDRRGSVRPAGCGRPAPSRRPSASSFAGSYPASPPRPPSRSSPRPTRCGRAALRNAARDAEGPAGWETSGSDFIRDRRRFSRAGGRRTPRSARRGVPLRCGPSGSRSCSRSARRSAHAPCQPSRHSCMSICLEQGPHRRPETPAPAETRLGHSGSPQDRETRQGPRAVQSGDRQQAARLRPRSAEGCRCLFGRSGQERTSITQSKTRHPVLFEITEGTRKSIAAWLEDPAMIGSEHLWPGRFHEWLHISTRQYARLVRDWVRSIGLEPSLYGTPFHAPDQGRADLPQDRKPAGGPASARPYEDGQHRSLPRRRARGRSGDIGSGGDLTGGAFPQGRPVAAVRFLAGRCGAASSNRSFVHRAAFSEGEGRQSGQSRRWTDKPTTRASRRGRRTRMTPYGSDPLVVQADAAPIRRSRWQAK
ncbi:hypothetical protein PSM7751_03835 [Pseudooceanicola marinus]|uniref:Phage integrase family protein n=1 Tax=Pseudooceanicola marinus TaxID=396013 RepID=A0A1X7A6I7_9RHOB|nr:hypothetical protein PSM7751_03835 [Pseudooceanicola marinus]